MKYKLSDICEFVKEKIDVANLDVTNYISTENMVPDKGGISAAAALPSVVQTQGFSVGDTLVSNIRPYFKKIWYAKNDGGCSNDVLVFRAKEGVNSRFLYYVLADDKFFGYAMATSKGTKMPRGDKKAIMEYAVPAISYDTQCKVADMLSSIDDKIETNTAINKNLEEQAQAIYDDLFSDAVYDITLTKLGTIVGGSTPSKKHPEYYTKKGIAWITPKDLSNNVSKFIYHGENDITELGLSKCSTTIMPKGTVLFSSRAPIGYIAIAANPVATNQGFKSVIPNIDIGTAFIYFFLKRNLNIIESMASGSTFKEISASAMKAVPAFMPNSDRLQKFRELCEPLFVYQQSLESENVRLSKIRDTLLPSLMLGEIDVSDIEI